MFHLNLNIIICKRLNRLALLLNIHVHLNPDVVCSFLHMNRCHLAPIEDMLDIIKI